MVFSCSSTPHLCLLSPNQLAQLEVDHLFRLFAHHHLLLVLKHLSFSLVSWSLMKFEVLLVGFVQLLKYLAKECQVLFHILIPRELVLDHGPSSETDSDWRSNCWRSPPLSGLCLLCLVDAFGRTVKRCNVGWCIPIFEVLVPDILFEYG
ncbi:hypothetical protein Tco_0418856 [Tanacetum coccineum]|uniref:Uncharacterized protein n=1 Tax=Tanacetum coccineum TaxID=301880 RepID=A0ABQ5FWE6_9ASTR